MTARHFAALATAVCLLAAGCGDTATSSSGGSSSSDINIRDVEWFIKTDYNKQKAGTGVRATAVECVERRDGEGADCFAKVTAKGYGRTRIAVDATYGTDGRVLYKADPLY